MALVLGMSALVLVAFGAALGALLARFLPRGFLYVFWAVLTAAALYQALQARSLDEFDRAGANITLYAVVLPLLVGSVITGFLVRRRKT